MTEALEWIQCKGCGRRHRWTAERAGKKFACSCGYKIYCPEGAAAEMPLGPADTLIESVESPSAAAPTEEELGLTEMIGDSQSAVARPLLGAEGKRAEKKLFVWTIWLLIGLAMVIHVVVLYPSRQSFVWLFWTYLGLAVAITPLALWRWTKARRRWQRGRPFLEALNHTIQRFDGDRG